MKKFLSILLSLLLIAALAVPAMAAEAKPGTTLTFTINFSNSDAAYAEVAVSYDKNVFQLVSLTGANGWVAGGILNNTSLSPLPSGKCGTLTLRVKDNAPAGTYTVSAYVRKQFKVDETNATTASASISNGSVTVPQGPCKEHKPGEWVVTKVSTCTTNGERVQKCSVCGEIIKVEALPLAEHTPGEWTVTKAPTCTAKGERVQKCSVCGTVLKTEELPMVEHKAGEWTVTKAPTCTAKGERVQKCSVCGTVLKTEELPMVEHKAGEWIVTKNPTCTANGEKVQKCTMCGKVLNTEVIPATGHDGGKWVIVKQPTQTEEGEKQLQCTKCGAVLKTEAIPMIDTIYYRMTACSEGIRFRDLENPVTDEWFMFTPVDLSQDGVQTFNLIAGNMHKIGIVTVTVENGNVTVTYELASNKMELKDEFFTLIPSIADVKSVDPAQHTGYPFGEAISIADDLNGDTNVLLYLCNHVNYDSDNNKLERFSPNGVAYKNLVDELWAKVEK